MIGYNSLNNKKKYKILFVCLGNICRSSCAEGVMRKLVKEAGLEDRFVIDSAGILSYHQGELPDPRMRAHAVLRISTWSSAWTTVMWTTCASWRLRLRLWGRYTAWRNISPTIRAMTMCPTLTMAEPRALSMCSTCWKTGAATL